MGEAARRWAELQGGRGIPPEILAGARADPWTHEPRDFTAPDVAVGTASRHAATVLLGEGGTVLDVGCGGGAAAFALDGITAVTGVDRQRDMLELFAAAATARGVPHRIVSGTWPDVAGVAGAADVVLCHHVLHNVVDLPPFLRALTAAARRGVVVEMLAEHPLAWLDPLWLRFHACGARHRPPSTTRSRCWVSWGSGPRSCAGTGRPCRGATPPGWPGACASRRSGPRTSPRRWPSSPPVLGRSPPSPGAPEARACVGASLAFMHASLAFVHVSSASCTSVRGGGGA